MNAAKILIVEDDSALREVLKETLSLEGFAVETANNGEQALRLCEQQGFDLLVSDVQMQPMDGETLLKNIRQRLPAMPVILMTAFGTVEKAVAAMRLGASDYLVKPFDAQSLVAMVSRFVPAGMASEATAADDDDFIAVDPVTRQLRELAGRVAGSDVTVMISGESGVGKEVVARYIHRQSSRREGPFVAINCAAIPETMLESVLFGYEKGAFTGACQARAGKFEQAQGGTLLLDEITEMDLGLQAKLLRVLQEKEVERIGGRDPVPLDVRIIATTNRAFHEVVAAGRFREDLFYRLNVFPVNLQPLRQRVLDIVPLAERFIERHREKTATGKGLPTRLSESAKDVLVRHPWPGNVRELDNVIQRALILKKDHIIDSDDLHFETVGEIAAVPETPLTPENEGVDLSRAGARNELSRDLLAREKDLIMSALASRGSRKAAAEKLGISPRTLRYKLARLRDAGMAIPA